jgi:exosome complex RNA-binding protein Rrp4
VLALVDSLWLEPSLTLSVDVGSADHSVVEVADSVADSVELATSEVHVALSVADSVAAGVASMTGVSE